MENKEVTLKLNNEDKYKNMSLKERFLLNAKKLYENRECKDDLIKEDKTSWIQRIVDSTIKDIKAIIDEYSITTKELHGRQRYSIIDPHQFSEFKNLMNIEVYGLAIINKNFFIDFGRTMDDSEFKYLKGKTALSGNIGDDVYLNIGKVIIEQNNFLDIFEEFARATIKKMLEVGYEYGEQEGYIGEEIDFKSTQYNVNKLNKNSYEERILNDFIEIINHSKIQTGEKLKLFATSASSYRDNRVSLYWFKINDNTDNTDLKNQLQTSIDRSQLFVSKIKPKLPLICLQYNKNNFEIDIFNNGISVAHISLFINEAKNPEKDIVEFKKDIDRLIYETFNNILLKAKNKDISSNLLSR